MRDLTRMRRDYGSGHTGLREDDLPATWVEQFDRWFADAVAAELPEPNAMVLATADADGAPDARIVLMKGYAASGFVFVGSYASAKGAQLAVNPRAALVFPWHAMQRQVRVAGTVEKVGAAASDALWDPRPRGAQLAAVASVQSTVVQSREELAERMRLLADEYPEGKLPRPDIWGGYRLVPQRVEFWQGGADRLHDRLRFVRVAPGGDRAAEGGGWAVQRLAPRAAPPPARVGAEMAISALRALRSTPLPARVGAEMAISALRALRALRARRSRRSRRSRAVPRRSSPRRRSRPGGAARGPWTSRPCDSRPTGGCSSASPPRWWASR